MIIGVTGRRQLPEENMPAIQAAVKDYFADVTARREGIAVVLTSLARGTDTLCAKQALEAGMSLKVALPMKAGQYRKDFRKAEKAEFDCLLSLADEVCVVKPTEPLPEVPSRGFFYRQAAIYVVDRCDELVAIWDGVANETADGAGTWPTIELARQAGKPIHYIMI